MPGTSFGTSTKPRLIGHRRTTTMNLIMEYEHEPFFSRCDAGLAGRT